MDNVKDLDPGDLVGGRHDVIELRELPMRQKSVFP